MKSNYKHGIESRRVPTQISIPIKADGCLQCVIGTAPVNLAEDPYDTVNRPFSFYSKPAAEAALGFSTDFESYTLCQSMYAAFDVFGAAPVVMINVLDPAINYPMDLLRKMGVLDVLAAEPDEVPEDQPAAPPL